MKYIDLFQTFIKTNENYDSFGTKKLKITKNIFKILSYMEDIFGNKYSEPNMKYIHNKYNARILFFEFLNREDIKEIIKKNESDTNEWKDLNYIQLEYEKYRPGHNFLNDLYVETEYSFTFAVNLTNKDEKKLKKIYDILTTIRNYTEDDPYGEEKWEY
jgi:CRISPR/Cas system CSM-associated protein Csm3 (group 7 of RAMP superfamily)